MFSRTNRSKSESESIRSRSWSCKVGVGVGWSLVDSAALVELSQIPGTAWGISVPTTTWGVRSDPLLSQKPLVVASRARRHLKELELSPKSTYLIKILTRDRLWGSDPNPLGFSWITSVSLKISTPNLACLFEINFTIPCKILADFIGVFCSYIDFSDPMSRNFWS